MARYLGQRIREARERLGLSQYETSKGICTQAYISKIENGNVFPTADILLKLANRFSIDISYLLDISSIPRHDYVIDAFTQIRESINNRDYMTVRKIVEMEKNNFLFVETKLQQFLKWHEGICSFQLDKDLHRAIQYLEEALQMTINNKKFFSEREIEILISQANIFSQCNLYEDAINKYEESITHINQLSEVINKYVPVRLFYNYARVMRITGKYYDSIHLCDRGLKLTEKHMLMYLRGDLYFQKAYNYKLLKDTERAVECFKLAEMVYIIENNQAAITMVKKHLDPLTSRS